MPSSSSSPSLSSPAHHYRGGRIVRVGSSDWLVGWLIVMAGKNYSDKELKDQGNKHFSARNYDLAIECYSQAILKNSAIPHYYTNRALCYLNQKRWDLAIRDAKQALEKDPNLVKGHFYLGTSANERPGTPTTDRHTPVHGHHTFRFDLQEKLCWKRRIWTIPSSICSGPVIWPRSRSSTLATISPCNCESCVKSVGTSRRRNASIRRLNCRPT